MMTELLMDTSTGGWIAGRILLVVFVLLAGISLALVSLYWRDFGVVALLIWLVCWVVIFGTWLWASWPLDHRYHYWQDKEGKVAEISKRLVPAGDSGMQEKIVVRMQGTAGVYGITETRAVLLKEGMNLHIKCKKAYDFGVSRDSHGWDCKYVSSDLDG